MKKEETEETVYTRGDFCLLGGDTLVILLSITTRGVVSYKVIATGEEGIANLNIGEEWGKPLGHAEAVMEMGKLLPRDGSEGEPENIELRALLRKMTNLVLERYSLDSIERVPVGEDGARELTGEAEAILSTPRRGRPVEHVHEVITYGMVEGGYMPDPFGRVRPPRDELLVATNRCIDRILEEPVDWDPEDIELVRRVRGDDEMKLALCGHVYRHGWSVGGRDFAGYELEIPTATGDSMEMLQELSDKGPRSSYLVIQEGGAPGELYLHGHPDLESAEADRVSCRDEGSYRTTPPVEIPASLDSRPEFYLAVQGLLDSLEGMDYPPEEGEGK